MEEIRCPKCGEVFQVDKNGYDQIARQVRDKEFLKELDSRLESDLKAVSYTHLKLKIYILGKNIFLFNLIFIYIFPQT